MAHPYHHALSSVKKWGGTVDDFIGCHEFFDASKLILADFRHRALRHHAEGIFLLEQVQGRTLTLSTGVYAPQSQGAVVAKLGNTQVLATANGAKEVREGRSG